MINQWKSSNLTNLFNLYDDHIEREILYPKLAKLIDKEYSDSRILDFGCGTGKFMEYICHDRELNITGCDISEEAL
ncbi:class I SAM-dependent methyltransferase, partial [Vibrio mimicus]